MGAALLFIVDPLESLKAYKDSSVAMMRAAQARGHAIWAAEQTNLHWLKGSVAAAATRYLQGSLYAVSPTDPATFAAVVGVLFAVAALAQWVPVAHAMRVDPAVALRQD